MTDPNQPADTDASTSSGPPFSPFENNIATFMQDRTRQSESDLPAPPSTLYHYTNTDGMFGILTSQRLWATSAPFLNDNSEVSHSLDLLVNIVHQPGSPEKVGVPHEVADRFMSYVATNFYAFFEVYLVCFSPDPDLLSQWQGYGQDSGYSLGFDSLQLPNQNLLRKINYDPELQRSALCELVKDWRTLFHDADPESVTRLLFNMVAMSFALPLSRAITTFKHPAFKHENEWRLIFFRLPMIDEQAPRHCRTRDGMLLPYVELPTDVSDTADDLLPLTEVRMGPRNYATIAGYAIQQLLLDIGYPANSVPIYPSSVPLRT